MKINVAVNSCRRRDTGKKEPVTTRRAPIPPPSTVKFGPVRLESVMNQVERENVLWQEKNDYINKNRQACLQDGLLNVLRNALLCPTDISFEDALSFLFAFRVSVRVADATFRASGRRSTGCFRRDCTCMLGNLVGKDMGLSC